MTPTPHYLIIGNGAAGLSAAEVIRRRDANGRITIVTNEPYRFYSRPGIAYYIMNQVSAKQLISRSENFYKEHRFNLLEGEAVKVDLEKQMVSFADGKTITYDVLLLATGAAAVAAPFPGSDAEGVLTFDTLDDAKTVVRQGRKAKTAVVVGGGITAMELSEGLRHQGVRTILLQRGDRIWARLFDEQESAIIEHAAIHEGVEIWYGEEIEAVVSDNGRVSTSQDRLPEQRSHQLHGHLGRSVVRVEHGVDLDDVGGAESSVARDDLHEQVRLAIGDSSHHGRPDAGRFARIDHIEIE
jgi:nitrite reductase (NADH) large subunit